MSQSRPASLQWQELSEKHREARLLIALSWGMERTTPRWMWRRIERITAMQQALQPSLFDVQPLVSIEHIPNESLDDRFSRWIKANPQVLSAFIHFADQARLRGWEKVGAKSIAERLRWEAPISTRGDDFKINNSFVSRLARLAVTKRPDLIELFEFRELRS